MIKLRSMSCSPKADYVEVAIEIVSERVLALWRIRPTERPGQYHHTIHRRGELLTEAFSTAEMMGNISWALKVPEKDWPAFNVLRLAVDNLVLLRFGDLHQHILEAEYQRGYEDGFRAWHEAHRQRRNDAPTFLYLAERGPLLKIGVSGDPQTRIASLSTGSGVPVVLVATRRFRERAAAMKAERQAHDRFAEHRVLGEWFNDVPEIRAYFAERKR